MSVLRCPVSTGVLWLVLGLIAGGGTSVAAQSVEAVPAGMAPCRTTAGGDGLLFRGLYGMVYSPVDFAQARTEATGLTVIDALRDGPGVVAVGGRALPQRTGRRRMRPSKPSSRSFRAMVSLFTAVPCRWFRLTPA